ncbi:hypothetical protein BBO99_00003218 [Phytophthora kernoviae]|uniref:Uncharacterized protein n=2 Tax=Phytophthora kernoviae TaxID=325452 RepID=A0A3R7NIU5_9STRA|nr:hypothetical protein G195_004788 [Phytophthora kernoviae 00238/432]KAG2525259.1 hypothetical protein JM16_003230 [Phytophthora kernoviae]KAG2526952.1 hypothetical protein JM18_003334 [Phytophthora kernoviae]RLN10946.1 hypothetical protein BBI17_000730 [Phytophthora kernoviae]RLN82041.1 hypothetical protein BBO99_00003218 [Phytophthora kernoviae]
MNVNATTIAALLGPGASPKAQIGQVQVGKCPARVQYLEQVIQLLHPNEPMDYLYSKYVMYADSPSLEPLGDCDTGKNNLLPLDMNELEWLLHSSPQDSNDVDMDE